MTHGGYHSEPEVPDDLFECAIHLRNNLFGITTEGGSETEYKLARARLMEDPQVKSMLPNFVRYSTDTKAAQLSLMTVASGSGSWSLRRSHVSESFQPLLTYLESGGAASDASIAVGLKEYDAPHVQATWQKAIDRRNLIPKAQLRRLALYWKKFASMSSKTVVRSGNANGIYRSCITKPRHI
jgi:hypothetical protein